MNDPDRTLERIGAALHAGDRKAIASCFAADATLVMMSDEDRVPPTGVGIEDAIDTLLTGFHDLKLTPTSRFVSSARVVEEAVVSGTHTGRFAGAEPTGGRVYVNVRLSTTWNPDSTVQSLCVEGDARALFAQIAGTGDVEGVTGGLVATARERYDGALHITDENDPPPGSAAASHPTTRPSIFRRRWVVATSLAITLFAAVLTWRGTASPDGHPARAASQGTASATQPARKALAAPKALPVIKRADTKAAPRVQAGKQVVLNSDVLFAFDSAALAPAAKAALTRLARQVRDANVTGTIQINGYTDNLGGIDSNIALSRTRALAVARVLQGALIGRPLTLAPQGFGQANPIAPNTSDTGRSRNRRVAIILPARR